MIGKIIKVSSKSNPNTVAAAIAGELGVRSEVEVQSIGAGALNQAVKAVAIAGQMLRGNEYHLLCEPSFETTYIEGIAKTAIRLTVFEKKRKGYSM